MENTNDVLVKVESAAKARMKTRLSQRYGSMAPGDYHRQGDVYLVRFSAVPPGTQAAQAQAQLAPGDTQGAKHVLDSVNGIKFFTRPNATPLDGPVLDAERQFTVTHPEHGDVTLPAGVYGVQYQRQFAEELRRVKD